MEHHQGTRIPESSKPFRKLPYFVTEETEGEEYSLKLANQSAAGFIKYVWPFSRHQALKG